MFDWFARPTSSKARKTRPLLNVEILEDRTVPTLLGQSLFPIDNPWNQAIASAPVGANSAAIINNIVTKSGDGRLHPDFGQDAHASQDLYGIPFNIVHGNSTAKSSVVIDAYADESDLLTTPIPSNVVLEGDFQNGPKAGVDNRGDSHLIVWDVDNNIAYEFYRASRPTENADGKWHADQESVWNMKTNAFRTLGFTSADAAGLSILAGLVRPDEALPVSQGGQGVINHAIRFTLQNSLVLDQFLYPASHVANPGNNNPAVQPPMGARFRLKADVDISQLNPQSRIIAQAMQTYGMIVADNGSNFFFSGTSDSVNASNHLTLTWNDNDIQDSVHGLKSLHFSNFEVVDLTPVVTGLSAASGQPGSPITVAGQNFSGAAGGLNVFFGATQASSVSYLDDGHLLVTIPNGSGTVDVRVQSGQSTAPDSQNIKSTIFGYGISATNANERFTFGASTGNAAPTVATAASATPNVVNGTTTALSLLGADDGGEANLTYTWSVGTKPTGALTPNFSVNVSNSAKNTTATFFLAGNYTFDVTIRDAQGLITTSSVTVTVKPILKSIRVTPASTTVRSNATLQFHADAYDQVGTLLSTQPTFTWHLIGRGSLGRTGLYKAPARVGGPYTITASVGTIQGSAKVTVTSALTSTRRL